MKRFRSITRALKRGHLEYKLIQGMGYKETGNIISGSKLVPNMIPVLMRKLRGGKLIRY